MKSPHSSKRLHSPNLSVNLNSYFLTTNNHAQTKEPKLNCKKSKSDPNPAHIPGKQTNQLEINLTIMWSSSPKSSADIASLLGSNTY